MFVYVFLLFAYRCFFNDFFVVVFITVFFLTTLIHQQMSLNLSTRTNKES